MVNLDLVKNIKEVVRGNPKLPLRKFVSNHRLEDHLRLTKSEQTIPEWLDCDDSIVVVRIPGKDGELEESDYTCFKRAEPTTIISVQPSSPTRRLDFQVVDTKPLERIHVSADLVLDDGTIFTWKHSLTSGSFFDEPVIPVTIQHTDLFTEAKIEIKTRSTSRLGDLEQFLVSKILQIEEVKFTDQPYVSLPAPRRDGHPIFLISIDTFRHDFLDAFHPVIDLFGPDATIPTEPRTQGTWTRPSHGAMLTGSHPLDNGVFGYLPNRGAIRKSQHTIPELLLDHSYKNSGFTTSAHLNASDGFARGFHRYVQRPMGWKQRKNDARDIVDTAIQWLDDDDISNYGRAFYFLHFLDPHYPYIPPYPTRGSHADLGAVDRFDRKEKEMESYLEILRSERRALSQSDLNILHSFYYESLEFVATQLRRLFEQLQLLGVYNDSFIIITGDHGEEFFERKFGRHESVNDANVRVGTIIKPPIHSDISVPDATDTIDILPTIARLAGTDVPSTSDGVAWQESRPADQARIVERFGFDWYVLGVEMDGVKGIFTYEKRGRTRPGEKQLTAGPEETEYYQLDDVRAGSYDSCGDDLTSNRRSAIRGAAEEFIRSSSVTDPGSDTVQSEPSSAVKSHLEELGYR